LTITASVDAALIRNTQPVPVQMISTPAIAGPTMRARLNVVEFSATALVSCSLPTISPTNDCRTGMSNAVNTPNTKHSTYTCHSTASEVTSSTPSTSAHDAMPDWTNISRRRLSYRSASTPAHSVSSNIGANCNVTATPSATGS
jgi:hypothetical protein